MPLSVLRTPLNEDDFMLLETTTNNVIARGNMEDMYTLKHTLETEEQEKANERWMAETFKDRLEVATSLMKSETAALNILKVKMPRYYSAYLKYKDVL